MAHAGYPSSDKEQFDMPIALIRAFANLWKKVNALPPAAKPSPQPVRPAPATPHNPVGNPLEELPLDYLIGTDVSTYHANRAVEAGYDRGKPAAAAAAIKYCNLFDEKNTGNYGPYLHGSDTAAQYAEGQIDPAGPGWRKNLTEQLTRAKTQGFRYVELDNPDAYQLADVIGSVDLAASKDLKVIAKNPLAMEGDPLAYVQHPAVVGVIVERGAGSPADMDALRRRAGKPSLPIWFVAFRKGNEDGRTWAGNTATAARAFKNMGVTFSPDGEYTSVQDVLLPNAGLISHPPVSHSGASGGGRSSEARPSGGDFTSRIVAAMQARNYSVAVGASVLNIVYIEGCELDGTPNKNRVNAFDSVRLVLRVLPDGSAKILGAWDAITHAGMYWEVHRMNPAGAFHIALGQQCCWQMGHYHDMEALIQSAPIVGTRDEKNNFKREGPTVRGDFGVHHHWGYNYPKDDAGRSSAGCQVGRTEAGHRQFIALLKTDARYNVDHGFMWSSTVMPVEWVK
jgi:hypothetical protein